MAYRYFSEKLIGQDKLDLSSVFPEKVRGIQQVMGINFGLPEIVLFIKQRSQDFKSEDKYLVELDFATKEIIKSWYKSIKQSNPFETKDAIDEMLDKTQQGAKPRDAVTTTDTGRVVPKPVSAPAEEPKRGRGRPPKKVEEVVETQEFNEDQVREAIELLEMIADDDPNAREAIETLKLLLP